MSLSEKLEAARVALGKRKERERELQAAQAQAPVPAKAEPGKLAPAGPAGGGNKLLAGHLAHEFLAHGTLLGRRIEPSRAGPAPTPAARGEPDPKRRYTEVSWLLMTSGAHIPGVVNPTQLGRWLQIKD
ncbi:uncharacterized protein LOC120683940 [Panicum virgatum]|uniref:Uncharacterized protein n=1 Tax=Panicum virgatum TaxID=38727 RepID=A0A8T0PXW8_PANVG|nr:uncharacterized protein LOC120683940 [Panicum virgatum]KAG2567361.1 hypothetical protein PVAP13_7NG350100 [Panicum virgatum]